MKTLISKLQLHYFEKGDFDKIESRSLPETLYFIHNFPWEEQRNELFVNLNGPSITIENGVGAFIKIGIYYNGRFILYYLSERNQIFCRIVEHLKDLDKDVADFFEKGIDETGLNKYRDGIIEKKKYFTTGKFEYHVSAWRILKLMVLPLFFLEVFSPAIILAPSRIPTAPLVTILLFVFFFTGIQWLLLFNYYFFSRNLFLKVSRGINEFYFGKKGKALKYNKKDIRAIRTYNNQWHKNPWSEFYTIEIEFRNGEVLRFTNLMIGFFKLVEKFPEVIVNDKHRAFPFVRKDKFKTIQ